MNDREKIKIQKKKLAMIKKLVELDFYGSVDDFIDHVIEYNLEIFGEDLVEFTYDRNWQIVEKLVELGHFSSSKELLNEGIEEILSKYDDELEEFFEIEKNEKKVSSFVIIGVTQLGKGTFRKWVKKGQKKRIIVVGSLSIHPNVPPHLISESIISVKVIGRFRATDGQRAVIDIIKKESN
jgi:Arc/MetJ-type ribon-helix-helix transcriptional regulator